MVVQFAKPSVMNTISQIRTKNWMETTEKDGRGEEWKRTTKETVNLDICPSGNQLRITSDTNATYFN